HALRPAAHRERFESLVQRENARTGEQKARRDRHEREVELESAVGDVETLPAVDLRDRHALRNEHGQRRRTREEAEYRGHAGENFRDASGDRERAPRADPNLLEHLPGLAAALLFLQLREA